MLLLWELEMQSPSALGLRLRGEILVPSYSNPVMMSQLAFVGCGGDHAASQMLLEAVHFVA